MDFINAVIFPVALMAMAFVGLQIFMGYRTRKLRGQPAPQLDGPPGDRVTKGESALFYFFSPSCGACRTMTPVIRELASRTPGVFPIDISQDMATAQRFKIMATPTTILVQDGTVVEVLMGPQSPKRLAELAGVSSLAGV